MRAWKEGLDFHQLVLADKKITSRVPRQQIELAFDLERQLKNVDRIFARVFGAKAKSARAQSGRPQRRGRSQPR